MAEDISINQDAGASSSVQQFGVVYGDVHIHQVVTPAPEAPAAAEPIRNPYKALNAFTSDDAPDFFGREDMTAQLVQKITPPQYPQPGDRFLAVVGASGSGKSSVVRAGLIPRLVRGAVQGVPWWTIIRTTPGEHPLEMLATQLGAAEALSSLIPSDILRELKSDARGLHRLAERALARRENNARLLLFVDQYEELYTLTANDAERDQFIAALLAAASDPNGRAVIVITLRADFYGRLTETDTLREWLPRRQVNIGSMTLPQLRRAVVGPAENVGLKFEPGLVERILEDVEDEPGALPLMQFALTRLFEQRQGNTLTLAAYDAIGGVQGALAQTADEAFIGLEEAEQRALRAALLRLVRLGEGQEDTRRRVTLTELRPARGDDALLQRTLSAFVNRRLLTSGLDPATRQPVYEVSHEALIRSWETFRRWLEEDRDDQRLMRQLNADAQRWSAEKRSGDFLAPRVMVERVETQLDVNTLNQLERDFYDASKAAAQRAAIIRRRLTFFAAAVAVVMTILAIFSVLQTIQAQRDRQFANEQAATAQAAVATSVAQLDETLRVQSLLLADLSEEQFSAQEYQVALLLALQSLANYPRLPVTQDSLDALHRVLTSPVQEEAYFLHGDEVNGALWSRDESRLLTWSDDGTVRLWPAGGDGEPLVLYHYDNVIGAAWSGDETRVLSWGRDNTARLWAAQTGQQLFYMAHGNVVNAAVWSPDETRVLTVSTDRTARIWTVNAGPDAPPLVLSHADTVKGGLWSADGSRVLTWCRDGVVRVWDAASGAEVMLARHLEDVLGAQWNTDSSRVLSWSNDDTARLWDVATGAELARFVHQNNVRGADFNRDESRVVTWSTDASARLWDAANGVLIRTFNYSAGVNGAALNRDETRIMGWADDGTVRIWDLLFEGPATILYHEADVLGAAWNADETELLSWSDDGTARIWSMADDVPLYTLRQNDLADDGDSLAEAVNGAQWNADETRLLTWSDDYTARVWSLLGSGEPQLLFGDETVIGARWNADASNLLTWTRTGRVQVRSAAGEVLLSMDGHTDFVGDAQWSPDETRIASIGNDKRIQVWDARRGESLLTIQTEATLLSDLAWSPDGRFLVTAEGIRPNAAIVYDTTSGQQQLVLTGHTREVMGVAWSPDGSTIASVSPDTTLRLWDATSGQTRQVLSADSFLYDVAWSPDGSLIAGSSSRSGIQIWRSADGELVAALESSEALLELAWSPDGTRILARSEHSAEVWDVVSTDRLFTLTLSETSADVSLMHEAAWHPDGAHVLTVNNLPTAALLKIGGGQLWLWNLDASELIAFGRAQPIRDLDNDQRADYFLPLILPTATPTGFPTATPLLNIQPPGLLPTSSPTQTPLPSLTPTVLSPTPIPSATITPLLIFTATPSP